MTLSTVIEVIEKERERVGQVLIDLFQSAEDDSYRVRKVILSRDGHRVLCKFSLSWATGEWVLQGEGEPTPEECLLRPEPGGRNPVR